MKEHDINPQTNRCVRCGRNAFNRNVQPVCMTTGDYVEKWNLEAEAIKDGETVCEHGCRPFECEVCYPRDSSI
jgi:hypothetical protein